MKKQLARNTGINYAKTAVSYALRLALVPVMLDGLGPTLFGVWVLVGSVTGASDLVQSGLGLAIAKYAAECEAKDDRVALNRIVSSAMLVSLGIAVLIVAAFAVFFLTLFSTVFRVPAELHSLAVTYAMLTLPAFLVSSVGTLYMRVFEGMQRFDVLAASEIAGMSVQLAIALVVFKTGHGLLMLGAASIALGFLTLAAAVLAARHIVPHVRPSLRSVDMAAIRQTASFSWSAIATKTLSFLGDRTNPWIIGAMLPITSLTLYSIASKFHEGARMVASLAASAVMPVASGLNAQEDKDRLTALHLRSIKYSAAISLPVIASGIILAPALIRHWVGPEYLAAAPLAQAYLLYLVFGLQTNPSATIMLGMAEQKRLLLPMTIATVVNVAVSIVAVLRYGTVGVIIGSGIGGLIVWASAQRITMRLLEEPLGRYLVGSMAAPYGLTVPVYLGLWLATSWLPPSSLFGVFVYAGVAWAAYMSLFVYFGLGPGEKADVGKLLQAVTGSLDPRRTK